MEKKRLVLKNIDRDFFVELNSIFYWKLESENNLKNAKKVLNFVRDDSISNLGEIRVVEMDYKCKVMPLFLALIPAVLAFALMTVALFLFIFKKDVLTPLVLSCGFLLPDFLLLGVTVFLTYSRTKQIEKYVINKSDLFKEAREKVAKIVNK